MTVLHVLATGPAVTVQDRGRVGWYSAGVGRAGAADRASAALANRLVGNGVDAAVVEFLLGGLVLRPDRDVEIAATGAHAQGRIDGVVFGPNARQRVRAGSVVEFDTATAGLWGYVAVRGGIVVDPVLGSRSRDTLAGLGPEPVTAGTVLPVGSPTGPVPGVDLAPLAPPATGAVEVRVVLGPRDDRFVDPAVLFEGTWTITDRTDRVGARLDRGAGPPLVRVDTRELATEGMPLGAVQVPPSGEPVVFLADHPVSGGYPVVATVIDADVDRVAQARPGQSVRFRRS